MRDALEHTRWKLARGRHIVLDRPRIMAVLNATPDSFYAGSRATRIDAALAAATRAWREGADLLDIGGESTRPGANRISAAQQIDRVIPIIQAIRTSNAIAEPLTEALNAAGVPSYPRLAEIPISIDTTRIEVAQAALDAGADAINDVSGGTESIEPDAEPMLKLAADRQAGLILMHRITPPDQDFYSDQYTKNPVYSDIVSEVQAFLVRRAHAAAAQGVSKASIMLDPGLGFGKSVEQNLTLIRRSGELTQLGYPILSALSRKSFVGRVGMPEQAQTQPEDRLAGTLGMSVLHLAAGATVFRVHDVASHRQALWAAQAILSAPSPQEV